MLDVLIVTVSVSQMRGYISTYPASSAVKVKANILSMVIWVDLGFSGLGNPKREQYIRSWAARLVIRVLMLLLGSSSSKPQPVDGV